MPQARSDRWDRYARIDTPEIRRDVTHSRSETLPSRAPPIAPHANFLRGRSRGREGDRVARRQSNPCSPLQRDPVELDDGMSRQRFRATLHRFAWDFYGLAALGVVCGFVLLGYALVFSMISVETKGTITHASRGRESSVRRYKCEFTTEQGEGDSVPVTYVPSRPTSVQVNDSWLTWLAPTAIIGVSGIWLAISLVVRRRTENPRTRAPCGASILAGVRGFL